jgi:hypothetical protein
MVVVLWGEPIGIMMQHAGARLIAAAQTPVIEMESPQDSIDRIAAEKDAEVVSCRGELEQERAARERQARQFAQRKDKK